MVTTGSAWSPGTGLRAAGGRALLFWSAALAVLAVLAPFAAAGAIDFDGALGAVPESLCNLAAFLQGPVGFAVVALIFFIGGIRVATGNRGGIGLIVTAFVVGLVFIAAPEILAVFTQDGCI